MENLSKATPLQTIRSKNKTRNLIMIKGGRYPNFMKINNKHSKLHYRVVNKPTIYFNKHMEKLFQTTLMNNQPKLKIKLDSE